MEKFTLLFPSNPPLKIESLSSPPSFFKFWQEAHATPPSQQELSNVLTFVYRIKKLFKELKISIIF